MFAITMWRGPLVRGPETHRTSLSLRWARTGAEREVVKELLNGVVDALAVLDQHLVLEVVLAVHVLGLVVAPVDVHRLRIAGRRRVSPGRGEWKPGRTAA